MVSMAKRTVLSVLVLALAFGTAACNPPKSNRDAGGFESAGGASNARTTAADGQTAGVGMPADWLEDVPGPGTASKRQDQTVASRDDAVTDGASGSLKQPPNAADSSVPSTGGSSGKTTGRTSAAAATGPDGWTLGWR